MRNVRGANAVLENLRNRGIGLNTHWVEQCIEYLSYQGIMPSDLTALSEKVYQVFLDADLYDAGVGTLPRNINDIQNSYLQGLFVLQIVEMVNVGSSMEHRNNGSTNRLLKIFLTDGKQQVIGVEHRRIPSISNKLPPGTKVAVFDVPIRHGALLLGPSSIRVLGGAVASLIELAPTAPEEKGGEVLPSNANPPVLAPIPAPVPTSIPVAPSVQSGVRLQSQQPAALQQHYQQQQQQQQYITSKPPSTLQTTRTIVPVPVFHPPVTVAHLPPPPEQVPVSMSVSMSGYTRTSSSTGNQTVTTKTNHNTNNNSNTNTINMAMGLDYGNGNGINHMDDEDNYGYDDSNNPWTYNSNSNQSNNTSSSNRTAHLPPVVIYEDSAKNNNAPPRSVAINNNDLTIDNMLYPVDSKRNTTTITEVFNLSESPIEIKVQTSIAVINQNRQYDNYDNHDHVIVDYIRAPSTDYFHPESTGMTMNMNTKNSNSNTNTIQGYSTFSSSFLNDENQNNNYDNDNDEGVPGIHDDNNFEHTDYDAITSTATNHLHMKLFPDPDSPLSLPHSHSPRTSHMNRNDSDDNGNAPCSPYNEHVMMYVSSPGIVPSPPPFSPSPSESESEFQLSQMSPELLNNIEYRSYDDIYTNTTTTTSTNVLSIRNAIDGDGDGYDDENHSTNSVSSRMDATALRTAHIETTPMDTDLDRDTATATSSSRVVHSLVESPLFDSNSTVSVGNRKANNKLSFIDLS